MIFGQTMMIRLVRSSFLCRVLKKYPITGILCKKGTPLVKILSVSSVMPPMTAAWPLLTSTSAVADLFEMTGTWVLVPGWAAGSADLT